MVVYTKRGDGGETSLGNGLRVAKDDVRIETNGELDELTSLLGIVTEYAAHDAVLQQQLMQWINIRLSVLCWYDLLLRQGKNWVFCQAI